MAGCHLGEYLGAGGVKSAVASYIAAQAAIPEVNISLAMSASLGVIFQLTY
ncbi:hypothetical protein [Shewanella morhuae]|uniref:hypothetical protein n=1 Tax=Shewanella morhuae TaxID=365591 RepID=UPI001BBEA09E|nr:hypothetical protein TUM4641_03550 [Shewanella morhuae]